MPAVVPGEHGDPVPAGPDGIQHNGAEEAVCVASLELDAVIALSGERVRDARDYRVRDGLFRQGNLLEARTESQRLRVAAFLLLLACDPRMALAAATRAHERRRFRKGGFGHAKIAGKCKQLVGTLVQIELERGPAQEPRGLAINRRRLRSRVLGASRFDQRVKKLHGLGRSTSFHQKTGSQLDGAGGRLHPAEPGAITTP